MPWLTFRPISLSPFLPVVCRVVETVIEGKADAAGGRRSTDARTAASSTRGKCYTTVCYSADGSCMLAGGLSKYVCIYAIPPRLLLRKFQLTHNRSLEGVLDKLNSNNLGPGGVLGQVDVSDSDDERDKRCVRWLLERALLLLYLLCRRGGGSVGPSVPPPPGLLVTATDGVHVFGWMTAASPFVSFVVGCL